MNVELYKMVKGAILSVNPHCPDGHDGIACASCLAEAVTHMLEDEFTLTSRWASTPLEEV